MQSRSGLGITKVHALVEAYKSGLTSVRVAMVPLAIFLALAVLNRLSAKISPIDPDYMRIVGEAVAVLVLVILGFTVQSLSDRLELFTRGILSKATVYRITLEVDENAKSWKVWLRAFHPNLQADLTFSFSERYEDGESCRYVVSQQFNILLHSTSSNLYWLHKNGPTSFASGDWQDARP